MRISLENERVRLCEHSICMYLETYVCLVPSISYVCSWQIYVCIFTRIRAHPHLYINISKYLYILCVFVCLNTKYMYSSRIPYCILHNFPVYSPISNQCTISSNHSLARRATKNKSLRCRDRHLLHYCRLLPLIVLPNSPIVDSPHHLTIGINTIYIYGLHTRHYIRLLDS